MKESIVTEQRAARRYHQMAAIEREMAIKAGEIAQAQAHLKELKETYDGLLLRLRGAARDEGALPLFSLDEP